MQVTYTLLSLINTQCWTLYLNWTDKKVKDKEYVVVKIISMFRTVVHFFLLVRRLKHGSSYVVSKEDLFTNDLIGNKNYFELAGGSSYRG